MKRHPVCITSTHTAYATSDTIIILIKYKPDFSSLRSYFLDRKLGPVCYQIGGHVQSSFLLGQCSHGLQVRVFALVINRTTVARTHWHRGS